ncbi:helix-turn-helix domain-containing protein [Thiotrichales bacterium 19X7-9]|nr:helix-turn-helix domain-containing protein [Thiotrichales bacterium 19X7-9]
MSSQVYSLLKKTRENKDISLAFVASKTGISESTLHIIETGEIELLDIPPHTIEAYITRYGEFLGLKELPSYELPIKSKSRLNLTAFDYIIRLAIIIVIALLIYNVLVLIKKNILLNSQENTHKVTQVNTHNQLAQTDDNQLKPTNSTPSSATNQMAKSQTNQVSLIQKSNNQDTIATTQTANDHQAQMPEATNIQQPVAIKPTEHQTTEITAQKETPDITTTSPNSSLNNSTNNENWNKAMQTAIDNSSLSN